MGAKLSVHLAKGWPRVGVTFCIPATRGRGVVFEKPSSDGTFSPISGARSITDQIRLRGWIPGNHRHPANYRRTGALFSLRFRCPPATWEGGGGLNEGRSSRTLGEATRYRGRQTANISLTLSPAPRKLSNGIHFISLRQTLSA